MSEPRSNLAPETPGSGSLGPGDSLILVDGSSFIFRAFFQSMNQAEKYNTRTSDGLPTGALRLFCTKLFQFVQEGAAGLKPTHLGMVFDKSEGSFRKELYAEYKGHRPDAPDELKVQMPLMRDATRAFGLIPVEIERYEADDLIAAYAVKAAKDGAEVLIVSSDKDLMQLVNEKVRFYDFESGIKGKPGYRPERNLDLETVKERWEGLPPECIGDVLALMGDTSDNVPGVPGIGLKTAAQLIREYGDLETLLARASEIKQPKRREALMEHAEAARLSKKLVTLDYDAPMPVPVGDLRVVQPDPKALIAFLKAMEFNTLTRRAATIYEIDPTEITPDPRLLPGGEGINWAGRAGEAGAGEAGAPVPSEGGASTPAGLAQQRALQESSRAFDRARYALLADIEALAALIASAREKGRFAIRAEIRADDLARTDILGLSFSVEPGSGFYLPLGHRAGEGHLFEEGLAPGQMKTAEALAVLKPAMEDAGLLKIAHDAKSLVVALAAHGVALRSFDDTMLLSYVLDAGTNPHGIEDLARRHLGHNPDALADLLGSGRGKLTFERVAPEKAGAFAAERADMTLRLWNVLKPRLVAEGRATVYETLERPLVDVLARMEARGILVDRQILSRLSGDFAQSLARLEHEIHEMAGESFQLGSPKQIGDILFGKMGLPGAKKTPSGQWATPATLLEELAQAGHELPRKILDWRQLAKLKSTYTDTLPDYIQPASGRVHTSYALAATATGRLSSNDPNLQNIPIRTEEGRKIRTAFIAPKGQKIVSADYSQIELRILAHMADIPQLKQAFSDGIDIHVATASAMFGVPVKGMDPDLRRRAKMINFGIIYGMSAFGLADRLGIPQSEAASFIKQYFERFPGIRDYIEWAKNSARENGSIRTIFGRVIHYPQIKSPNPQERQAVERQAINAPIQGSAADIIRRAMTRMEPALGKAGLSARMLLQVHDELVFEVPDEEVEATLPVIAKAMEDAPFPAVTLSVPLAVDARAAQNWEAAH